MPPRLLLFLTLALLVACTQAGNCSVGTPHTLVGGNMAVDVSGGVALIYPVINGVPSPDSFSLQTQLVMAVERLRDTNFSGHPNRECMYAKRGDPLATTGDGEILGEILGYVDITEFDCYIDNYTVNYGLGRLVDTVRVTFSQNGSSLHHVAYFEISNTDFVKKRYNDTTHTHGKVYEVKYTKNVLKLSYDLAHYPFEAQSPNKSFVSLHHTHQFTLGPGLVQNYDYQSHAGFNWTSADGLYTLFLDLETAFVLDDYAYSDLDVLDNPVTTLTLYNPTTLAPFQTGMRMCESNDRWTYAYYDPTIGILFNLAPSSPEQPPTTSSGLKRGQIVGITLGVVLGVCAVVAVVVLLAIKVPAVQEFFRPFSRRNRQRTNDLSDRDPKPKGWKPSRTPTA